MKKIHLLASATALATLFSLTFPAQAQTNDASYMSNFYLGAFGGYGWTDADDVGGPELDVDGGDYGLFAGYEITGFLDRTMDMGVTGAIEFHYAWSDADDTVGATTVKKNDEWGVSFRPGLKFLSDAMPLGLKPYGIIGYRNAEFETTIGGVSDKSHHDGFELGIGTEVVTYGSFGVRLDYSHVFYESEAGLDPSENDLRLGLTYHF